MAKQLSVIPNYMPIRVARSLEEFEKANPDRHPRWIRNDPARARFLVEKLNYRIERTDGKTGLAGDNFKGAITSGSDILVSCPKDEFLAREEQRRINNMRQLEGPRETFKTEAKKSNVKTEDKTTSSEGTMLQVIQEGDSNN